MDRPDNRAHDDAGDPAADWLRARLTAQAARVPVPPPDLARIDTLRRGVRNRRTGWAACAVAAVAAGAVVATVALAGGGGPRATAVPPAAPTVPAPPTATASPVTPLPTGDPESPPPAPVAQPGRTNEQETTAPSGTPATPVTNSPPGTPANGTGTTTRGTRAENAVAACTAGNLVAAATKEPADSEQPRHILISVRNTGGTTCDLYHYPHVLLGDARTTAPVIPDSDPEPGKPVTLAPGAEAYAAMVLNGPMDEYEVRTITLTLHGPTPGSRAGGSMNVPMPVAMLYANDFQRVTYWTTAPGLALDFVMSR